MRNFQGKLYACKRTFIHSFATFMIVVLSKEKPFKMYGNY